MLYSLRLRLLLTFLLITILAVTVVAVFARQETADEFHRYIARDQIAERQLVFEVLEAQSMEADLAGLQSLAETMGTTYNLDIMVVDANGQVIVSSMPDIVGVPLAPPSMGRVVGGQLTVQEMPAQVVIAPMGGEAWLAAASGYPSSSPQPWMVPLPDVSAGPGFTIGSGGGNTIVSNGVLTPTTNEATFFGSVNHSFWAAAAAAVGIAGLLSVGLSQRILQPVQALTAAANRLEQGDLNQRVQVNRRDEIGTLAHAFNAMADGLQRQEQLRRHMVTDIAHELRTPLTNIRGYLEALQDGYMEASPAVIDSLHQESLLLHRLINDLQELSLAEAGQLKLDLQPVSLAELVELMVGAMRPQLNEKSLTLTTDLPPDLPLILADPARTGQVLRNLLQNAIVYTPERGRIHITAQVEGDELLIQVQDSGPGIAPEHLPHLFDRFYRADESRNRATGGTGLGLAIVKVWVEGMRGRVWAESVPGEGARFWLALPVADEKE
ncbi:MAG: HAMP domain-containing protein [Chloroflexi bacterium]|nr:HAMP domain-containing protein [Chloroflexota bacterium]